MFYEPGKGPKGGNHGLPHNPLKNLFVPRPIGWFTTMDAQGRVNLAPYSFFNIVAGDPPIIVFGTGPDFRENSDDPRKDTQRNIEETGEFVFNLATYDLKDQVKKSGDMLPYGEDEVEYVGLTKVPSKLVSPPRIKESPVQAEGKYLQTIQLPSNDKNRPTHLILGEIVGIHISDELIEDGKVNTAKAKPLARLGYYDYGFIENIFPIK